MNNEQQLQQEYPDQLGIVRLKRLAPRPKCLEDTGLSRELLIDLIAKHLLDRGTLSLGELAGALCLPGVIVENLLGFMRTEAMIEIRPGHSDEPGLNYTLTDRGRATALDAMMRGGYIGPAPVNLAHYSIVVKAQSIHKEKISRDEMHNAFREVVIEQSLLDRLGASVNSGRAIFLYGGAGTGKTYLAVAAAVDALEHEQVRRIVLVRPAVEAGERLGFLPGDMSQKVDPYLRPLYDALRDMLPEDRIARYMERGVIEVAPLAYMRGRTLSEAAVILDEAQNTTIAQMKMFLTRIGFGSTAVITGDITQIDLPKGQKSGLVNVRNVLSGIDGISFTHFGSKDVVRHPLVQKIVDAYEAYQEPHASPDSDRDAG